MVAIIFSPTVYIRNVEIGSEAGFILMTNNNSVLASALIQFPFIKR